jgi:hypothetical protein
MLHAALILAGCVLFYKLILQKETFYEVNRFVLLGCMVLSFVLPFLPVPRAWSFRKAEASLPVINTSTPGTYSNAFALPGQPGETGRNNELLNEASAVSRSKIKTWIVYLYWFGVVAFGINFLLQAIALLYQAYSNPVIRDGRIRIIEVSGNKAPCSFGNNIFINPEKYEWETYNQILLHEKVHVCQGHSLDILLAELVLIFQWFNPFAWLYRKEVEKNLEFGTDARLLEKAGIEKESYQINLLKVSAPHLPLSLTTNYNQSLLKTRFIMMNAKKSNVHTTWKYFFLLPLLVLLVCLLNEPVAMSQSRDTATIVRKEGSSRSNRTAMEYEGSWFATIKNDNVSIQFKSDEDEHSFNTSSFSLKDLPALPREAQGEFSLRREAGTMLFRGKFEGDQGMGRYQFTPDESYVSHMRNQNIGNLEKHDMLAFFFIDIKKSYLQMLKDIGYKNIQKNDLIPLAALKVDAPFIKAWRENGFKDVTPHELITLKSLRIDADYVSEIRSAGYKDVSLNQLVTFKAQGIDGKYITDLKRAKTKAGKQSKETTPEEVVAVKALNIDPDYIKSFEEVGYKDLPNQQLVAMKSLKIDPEFVKLFHSAGYKDIPVSRLIALKSQNITPEYIKAFHEIGYKNVDLNQLIALKSQNITPAFIKTFTDLGYTNIDLNDVIALKSTGVSSEYISAMKAKGFDFKDVSKYIQLKSLE